MYIMQEKPYLILELDEHSAVAGVMTRLEAFRNVIENTMQKLGNDSFVYLKVIQLRPYGSRNPADLSFSHGKRRPLQAERQNLPHSPDEPDRRAPPGRSLQELRCQRRAHGHVRSLDLGKAFTSGKECFPCQVTTGDILLFLRKRRKGWARTLIRIATFYFMPEAEGPCRFGMYNKYQRIVLDSFPELESLKIGSLTSKNAYALDGMLDQEQTREFRKVGYFSVVVSDVLDRLLWRVRPYEKQEGMADECIERATTPWPMLLSSMAPGRILSEFSTNSQKSSRKEKRLLTRHAAETSCRVVGEIYLRTHVQANQDVIRMLEKHGAEVVNASIAEWINYTTYDRMREARIGLRLSLKQLRVSRIRDSLKKMLAYRVDLSYQHYRQDQVYKRVKPLLDLAQDHRINDLDRILGEEKIYSFDVGTEACLSIPGILEYVHQGYNGWSMCIPSPACPAPSRLHHAAHHESKESSLPRHAL